MKIQETPAPDNNSTKKNHSHVNTESGWFFIYTHFVRTRKCMLFILARAVFLLPTSCEHGSSMHFILARAVFYYPLRASTEVYAFYFSACCFLLPTSCEHGSSMHFILARAVFYYPLRASTKSGVILRILREFASGAY